MTKMKVAIATIALAVAAGAAWKAGWIGSHVETAGTPGIAAPASETKTSSATADGAQAPAVTVARAETADFVETVLVTGSLVPREEIIVAPEVDGLRVQKINNDEGDRVKEGDVLAVLVSESLDAQLAQNEATLARAAAAIAQAASQIKDAEARVAEADASLERARPLVQSKYLSESVFDQRQQAARSARAQLAVAQDGLRLAEAEKAQVDAQRRELNWRRSNTEVKAPADGIISRRGARIGAIAVGGTIAGAGETLFRIIAKGEIELDAEVAEARMGRIAIGQKATVEAAGSPAVEGTVRLVSPEVEKSTRLGRVRIFIGDNAAIRVGSFARASIETARARGLSIPQSAILYGADGPVVQLVVNGQVKTRRIETGLSAGGRVEVKSGLTEGDTVVAKAGTFLRDGDLIRPITPAAEVSEANK